MPDRVNHIRKLQKVDGVEIYAQQYTTIQRAAQTSDVAGIRYFVAKGMLNDADEMGNTALHEGARFGYQNIVRELCAQGCDVNTRNNIKQTPAHLATAGARRFAGADLRQGRRPHPPRRGGPRARTTRRRSTAWTSWRPCTACRTSRWGPRC